MQKPLERAPFPAANRIKCATDYVTIGLDCHL